MSNRSNDQGRAYEYITLIELFEQISSIRPAKIVENSSLVAAKSSWEGMSDIMKNLLLTSAKSFVPTTFELEPLILENDNDIVSLLIQKDVEGENGDVRDILIIRSGIQWEIGLSMKHNHFAVKHSRLSSSIDFGSKWYGYPCSQNYWSVVNPIFDYLKQEKNLGRKWSELPDKAGDVYIPLLKAFMMEIKESYLQYRDIPMKMVEYLLGEYDFYKIISIDRAKVTQINAFNLHGTLNSDAKKVKASIKIERTLLPTRIVHFDFKPDSNNTLELYLDNGWQFSFRIHNASTKVENSLKFDIQIIGMPATIITIDCKWK